MNKNTVLCSANQKKLKIMDEKFNFNFKTSKINIEKIADDLAERNEAIRQTIKVRDLLIDSTEKMNEEEIEIALAIIELGTGTVIGNL